MEYPGSTRAKRKELAQWVQQAFNRLANMRYEPMARVSESAKQAQVRFLQCGRNFTEILIEGEANVQFEVDLPKLRDDLSGLMEKDCPSVDIVELAIGCTSGGPENSADVLHSYGLNHHDLLQLRSSAASMARIIGKLCRPSLSGISFLSSGALLASISPEELDRVEELPNVLTILLKILDAHPLRCLSPAEEDLIRNFPFALLSLLLEHFGLGYPTMSRILMAMRYASELVSPRPKPLHRISPSTVNRSEKMNKREMSEYRDPFSPWALQRRLHRFYDHTQQLDTLRRAVREYVSSLKERQVRETLSTVFWQICATISEGEHH